MKYTRVQTPKIDDLAGASTYISDFGHVAPSPDIAGINDKRIKKNKLSEIIGCFLGGEKFMIEAEGEGLINRFRPLPREEIPWHKRGIARNGFEAWAEMVNRDPMDLLEKLRMREEREEVVA